MLLLCSYLSKIDSYLSMESDVSDSRPHFYSLLYICLTAHTLTSTPHCIHILMLMLIHNFILVQSLILILKHTWASHFFHSFRHSPSYDFIYKLFFVITFSSQCDLQSSFSSLIRISTHLPPTLVSIQKSCTTATGYNILTICYILYLDYIICIPYVFI